MRGPFILILLPISMIGRYNWPILLSLLNHSAGYILSITAKTNGTRYVAVFLMAIGLQVDYMRLIH